jgi:hypothetical protein
MTDKPTNVITLYLVQAEEEDYDYHQHRVLTACLSKEEAEDYAEKARVELKENLGKLKERGEEWEKKNPRPVGTEGGAAPPEYWQAHNADQALARQQLFKLDPGINCLDDAQYSVIETHLNMPEMVTMREREMGRDFGWTDCRMVFAFMEFMKKADPAGILDLLDTLLQLSRKKACVAGLTPLDIIRERQNRREEGT